MKKTLAIIMTIVMCIAVVVACCACDLDDDVITVTIYSTMGKKLKETFDTYLKQFEKMYPGIKVVHETPLNDYDAHFTRINTELKNGDGPSIAYCYPDHVAQYNRNNRVLALDKYIDSTEMVPAGKFGNTEAYPIGWTTEEKADFVESFYKEGYESYGDGSTMYSLPYAKSSEALFYNKTFLDAHSDPTKDDYIEVPTHWWTTGPDDRSSVEYVCAKIKEIDSNCIPLGYDADDNFFITMCEQYQTLEENKGKNLYTSATGTKYLFDNDVNKEWMTKLNKLYQDGLLITKSTNSDKHTSNLFTARDDDDNARCTYMCIGSTGGATYQISSKKKFEVGIAGIPQMNPDDPKVISQGPSICILKTKTNKTEDQQLAAWLVAKYMTTNVRLQAMFSMDSGYVPSIKSAHNDPTYKKEFIDKANGYEYVAALAAKQCLEQIDYSYTSPAFYGSSDARDQVEILMSKCLILKNNDPQTLAQEMANAFKTAIDTCEFNAASGAK